MLLSAPAARQVVWRVELLGPLRVLGDGRSIERFPTQMTAGLLALLALHRGRRLGREEIIDTLWPEADLPSGRDRLSQALVWLRHRLEPAGLPRGAVLQADRLSVALDPETTATDLAAFNSCLERARREERPGAAVQALLEAAELYRGDLLSDLHVEWVLPERRHVQETYLRVLRRLASLLEQRRDFDLALEYAQRAVAADPLLEEAHCDVIRVLASAGRTAAALRQYREMQRVLERDLGVSPSSAAAALIERVRSDATRAGHSAVPPSPPALPTPLTRFYGREAEIARLLDMVLVQRVRLVTLLGVGGAGKTRLALEAASRLAGRLPVLAFVPLADVGDPARVPAAIADALRLPRSVSQPPLEQVVQALATTPALLVLDNLEHIVTGAAPIARTLLDRLPQLTIVATARQRLRVEGEQAFPVLPLRVPHAASPRDELLASESVQLFLDRGRAVSPDLALTPENAGAVARLCERLEGIPLAIELCAAWASVLTPAQMLSGLDRRFDLLVSRRTDVPWRHRSLYTALDSSFSQLSPELQTLSARFSVFRGGWTIESAAAICFGGMLQDAMATLVALTELCERSMLLTEATGSGDGAEMRYRMLEALREFADGRLSPEERAEVRAAHAAYFLGLAERAEVAIGGSDQKAWLARVDREQENLRVALAWSLDRQDIGAAMRLAGALGRYWSVRGLLVEGIEWLHRIRDAAASLAPGDLPTPEVRAKAFSTLGYLEWLRSDFLTARSAHEAALALRRSCGDRAGEAESLYHLGITAYRREEFAAAHDLLEQSLSIAREQADRAGIARVLLNLGNLAYERHDYAEARTFLDQSLVLEEQLGNRQRAANVMNNLGLVATVEGDYPRAMALFEDALTVMGALADHYGTAIALSNMGDVLRRQRLDDRAWVVLAEGAQLAHRIGNKHILAYCFLRLGLLAYSLERDELSVRLLTAALEVQGIVGDTFGEADMAECRAALDGARRGLGDETYAIALANAQTDSPDLVVALAMAARESRSSTGGR